MSEPRWSSGSSRHDQLAVDDLGDRVLRRVQDVLYVARRFADIARV
jgi:hypothetical protein